MTYKQRKQGWCETLGRRGEVCGAGECIFSELSRFLNVRLRMLKIELTRAVTGSGSGPLGYQNKASPSFKILEIYALSART